MGSLPNLDKVHLFFKKPSVLANFVPQTLIFELVLLMIDKQSIVQLYINHLPVGSHRVRHN